MTSVEGSEGGFQQEGKALIVAGVDMGLRAQNSAPI